MTLAGGLEPFSLRGPWGARHGQGIEVFAMVQAGTGTHAVHLWEVAPGLAVFHDAQGRQ